MSVYEHYTEKGDEMPTAAAKLPGKADGKGMLPQIDRDTLLTAAVLLLMLKNGGDMKLIIALTYIIIGKKEGNEENERGHS